MDQTVLCYWAPCIAIAGNEVRHAGTPQISTRLVILRCFKSCSSGFCKRSIYLWKRWQIFFSGARIFRKKCPVGSQTSAISFRRKTLQIQQEISQVECSQRHLFGVLRCVLVMGNKPRWLRWGVFGWILLLWLSRQKNRGSNKFRNKIDMKGHKNIDTQKEILFHKSWDSGGLRPTNNKMKRNNNNNNNNNKKNKVLQLAI